MESKLNLTTASKKADSKKAKIVSIQKRERTVGNDSGSELVSSPLGF